MSSPNEPQSRRTFLKRSSVGVAGSAVAGGLPVIAFGANAALAADEAAANPVVRENRFADASTFSTQFRVENISSVVEGYARRTSVNLGEPIELAISGPNRYLPPADQEPVEAVDVELYRLGYYDGKGARLVWKTAKPVSTWQRFNEAGEPVNEWEGGNEPPIGPIDPATGLLGRKNNKTTLTIPGDAAPASGV
ncbi:MAG: twin-arginine translocation signal domain-containing protein, partial [Solirubrobacteraceae bacterium]|nr:twin-arginine translocation signal domain-containing protein [Solirubrobacteraceae bacterium]